MNNKALIHMTGGVSLAIVTAAAWFFLLQPAMDAHGNYRVLVNQLQEQRGRRTDLQSKNRVLQAQIAALQETLAKHPLALKPPEEVNARLQAITDLAFKAGFQLDSLEAGRQDDFEQYGAVEVRLAGKCPYPVFQQFLRLLATRMPDMALSAADVSGRYNDSASVPAIALKLRWHTASKAVAAAR